MKDLKNLLGMNVIHLIGKVNLVMESRKFRRRVKNLYGRLVVSVCYKELGRKVNPAGALVTVVCFKGQMVTRCYHCLTGFAIPSKKIFYMLSVFC